MRRNGFFLLTLLALAAGCDRRDRLAAPDSTAAKPAPPAAPERAAYLSVSELAPAAGSNVIVAGTVTVGSDLSVGSFRVRVAYDTAMLRFVEEIVEPGMMRVVNPRPGEVIVVGASSGSSTDGRLFTLRFRVSDPAGLNSLVLHVDELNDASFQDQRQSVIRASRLVHDSSLARAKAVPR
jgi:hypothetical protein